MLSLDRKNSGGGGGGFCRGQPAKASQMLGRVCWARAKGELKKLNWMGLGFLPDTKDFNRMTVIRFESGPELLSLSGEGLWL